jgi:dihydropteroate synthase
MKNPQRTWSTSRRKIDLSRPIVMAILNVTPDSFSDGGRFSASDSALRQAEKLVREGADIIDIGGESTRPSSGRVAADEEISRVAPVIEAVSRRFNVPISIDTSKSEVAQAALNAGAEIINDISGLRFDKKIAAVAADTKAGLVLMHSRGEFETMHSQPPVEDIMAEVASDLRRSTSFALEHGVRTEQIVLDVGIGFGKRPEQNLELIAKLDELASRFSGYPILVGTSRKSFIGKLLNNAPPDERLYGSLATVALAVWNGAKIVRVHDVKPTLETINVVAAALSAAA